MKFEAISSLRATGAALLLVAGLTGVAATGASAAINPTNHSAAVAASLSSGAQDILKLARAKVDDEVTLAFIRNSDRRYDLSAAEIVQLRDAGVSDRVLAAMITHQPEPTAAAQAQTAMEATATAPVASAPQYTTPPATSAVVETAPSTVYVSSGVPSYYSFYDPWPYYWNYWYYPYFSIGWYWGWGCWGWGYPGYCWNPCWNNGWNGCWDNNNQCNNGGNNNSGNPSANNGNQPPSGGDQSSPRTPPTRQGSGSTASVAGGNRPVSPNATATSGSETRSAVTSSTRTSPAARPNGSGDLTANGNRQNTPATRTGQNSRPDAAGGAGTFGRTAAVRPNGDQLARANQSVVQRPGAGQNTSPSVTRSPVARTTSTWTSQQPAARPVAPQSRVAYAPTSRVSAAPTTVWTRSTGSSVTRVGTRPAMNYSSGGRGATYSPRVGGSSASFSRPSMSAPSRSMGSSAFRSGGGMSGGGSARPSMGGGGGFRGGGGRSR